MNSKNPSADWIRRFRFRYLPNLSVRPSPGGCFFKLSRYIGIDLCHYKSRHLHKNGSHQVMNPQLLLRNIRNVLVRLEETIMFNLIERAQFKRNEIIYNPESFATIGSECLVDHLLHETEKIHARVRRYESPDEHPFNNDLPEAVIPPLSCRENPLHPNNINVNAEIKKGYLRDIVPLVCNGGDDRQYGSSAVADVACLQSLSKRIHYGKFVAESKFRGGAGHFTSMIKNRDKHELQQAITDEGVESEVLQRVERKACTYLRELTAEASDKSVSSDALVKTYRDFIIPLTKRVEVEYLLQRLDKTG